MKERKKFKFLKGIILVILFIVGFIVGFYSNKKDSDSELPDGTNKALLIPTMSYTRSNKANKVNKNTVIELTGRFKYSGKKTYYYKFQVLTGTTVTAESSCKKIDYSNTSKVSMKITADNQYGRWVIYSDSSCNKKVIRYRTASYDLNKNTEKSSASTSKTFTATFNANGATSIGATSLSCTTTGRTCTVKAPTISRNGYVIKGWSKRKNSSFAVYQSGENIILYSNSTYYAITTKQNSNTQSENKSLKMVKYNSPMEEGQSGILSSSVSPNDASVTYTSSNPKVIRISKTILGVYKMYTISPGTATITATSSNGLSDSITYQVIAKSTKNASNYLIKGIKDTINYDGYNIYVENGCDDNIVNSFIDDIKAIPINHSYPKAVYILSNSSLAAKYPDYKNAVGISQGNKTGMYVSIVCDNYHETVVAHEFGHVLDNHYSYATGNDYLSNNSDLIYQYKNNNVNTALNDNPYAYQDLSEFFATSYSYYYKKHYATQKWNAVDFNKNKFPIELESTMYRIIKTVETEL